MLQKAFSILALKKTFHMFMNVYYLSIHFLYLILLRAGATLQQSKACYTLEIGQSILKCYLYMQKYNYYHKYYYFRNVCLLRLYLSLLVIMVSAVTDWAPLQVIWLTKPLLSIDKYY